MTDHTKHVTTYHGSIERDAAGDVVAVRMSFRVSGETVERLVQSAATRDESISQTIMNAIQHTADNP